MGIVYYRKFNFNKERKYLDEAISSLEKALKINPKNKTIQEYLNYFRSML